MKKNTFWAMTLILLVAAGLRLWALPQQPVGLHYDEAANVILTRQIAAGDYAPIFIRAYTGKEVFFFYAAAPWLWITGGAAWGLRLGAAMLGILTVAATFSATRAMLGRSLFARWTAVLASAWMAVVFPHLLLSRYGFRAISQPLLQALTVATLWWGLRTGKRRWFIAGGVCLGLTGYTYLAARLFPIPLGFAMGWMLIRTPRANRKQRLGQLLFVLIASSIIFAPLGVFFLRYPETFTTRITQVAAPSLEAALHGFGSCVRALAQPGKGEAYVRFNIPGRPLLDVVSAVLGVVGLFSLCFTPSRDDPERATQLFLPVTLVIMLLPSALATSEITPSNLRLVGVWPFLALFPAMGLMNLWRAHKWDVHYLKWLITPGLSVWFCLQALTVGEDYHAWATSSQLFHAADGAMVQAAQALDAQNLQGTTVYIVSKHYRHPTVAALSKRYPQAKWLVGGETWVLPVQGDALYLVPHNLTPSDNWPESILRMWVAKDLYDRNGHSALSVHKLSEESIATLRPTDPPADFAHVALVHSAHLSEPCYVGTHCKARLIWEAYAPYPTLQPVVSLVHPRTREWSRSMEFHYPSEQWSVGDVVFDQLELDIPESIPPGSAYQLNVGFYDPTTSEALPRLENERFAGLGVRFPIIDSGFSITSPLSSGAMLSPTSGICGGIIPENAGVYQGIVLFEQSPVSKRMREGESLFLKLCWSTIEHPAKPLMDEDILIRLVGPETYNLYIGPPAESYGFSAWLPGQVVQGRYPLRIPRTSMPGEYALTLSIGETQIAELANIKVEEIPRQFVVPDIQHPVQADFGDSIRLLGYDIEPIRAGQPTAVTFYWQSLLEIERDYTVFVHLIDQNNGQIIAQVDEGPRNSTYPTSLWVREEIVSDPHALPLSQQFSDGSYALKVGFYLPESGDYLHINEDEALVLPLKQ